MRIDNFTRFARTLFQHAEVLTDTRKGSFKLYNLAGMNSS